MADSSIPCNKESNAAERNEIQVQVQGKNLQAASTLLFYKFIFYINIIINEV